MRLCSIISVWGCCFELLPCVIKNHLEFCDGVIVLWSINSNHGVKDTRLLDFVTTHRYQNVLFHQLEPIAGYKPLYNETRKRNKGLDIARAEGYTHFLIADADEMYDPISMNNDKSMFNRGLNGLVHKLHVYVGKPTLWCYDHTLVPGIHKLTKDVCVGTFRKYPFAYDEKGNALIDPSRRPSSLGIRMSETVCHHYSYVRKNIDLKIDNSSANLKRSRQVIYDELRDAKPGYFSKLYHQPLNECENYFNIEI